MSPMKVRELQVTLGMKMQLMESYGADFTTKTWTFRAPTFYVSAGDHLVISKKDWIKFWDELTAVSENDGR